VGEASEKPQEVELGKGSAEEFPGGIMVWHGGGLQPK
jgi:hypothetical protein